MGGKIRLLPDGVIDQIAAGEVVERPASILKELLENAVDASAGRIEAQVFGAFPFSLRVSDDGVGMTAEDAETAVRRHTTSKIFSADDLQKLVTYGFRGEALPSIASVSRLRILTRPSDRNLGTEVVVEGGKVRSVQEAGAPPGTTVEVSNLFGNVPARRKFLKTPRTEMAHLWEVFHGVAIPREGIFFRMCDGRTEAAYERGETRLDRAKRHAGEGTKYLVPLHLSSAFFRITGWTGLPHLSRFGSSGVHFFVNGRHFRDKGVFAAVREAYRGILPPDRLPVIYLFLECDPSEADVNVHPAKMEVRFRYGKDLFELVRHAIGEALGEIPAEPAVATLPTRLEIRSGAPLQPRTAGFPRSSLFEGQPAGFPDRSDAVEEIPVPERGAGFGSLRPVAQLMGMYILCEGTEEVVIIDQHAADERIVFSRLKDSYLGKNAPVQRWLVPQIVSLPGAGKRERAEIEEFLEAVGFLCESVGENTFKISGGPAILGHFDLLSWWKDLGDFLLSQGSAPKGIFDADRELWRIACHASLRAGMPLEREGMRSLLSDLDRAIASHSCPHGRPVWVKISAAEMKRMFGRT
ncbi:MAG TPA: DNA mismatch repair endonuclease MutL [Candidatus Deferrimicrobiaceae bacterium]|nr:DNA mismatch repair endonuclease MutL [Candidatus Deferrimicrobiaceae bacterium]